MFDSPGLILPPRGPRRRLPRRSRRRSRVRAATFRAGGGSRRARSLPWPVSRWGSTYDRRPVLRSPQGEGGLWITFLRRFWGVFLGGFLEATGPGAGFRGVFSADGVLLVRWASANFDFFRGFFTFLVRFLPVFRPYFALFPSMPCAYLYVNNYFSASLARDLRSLQRRARRERPPRRVNCGRRRIGERRPSFAPGARLFSPA